jgi:hypothetical protein
MTDRISNPDNTNNPGILRNIYTRLKAGPHAVAMFLSGAGLFFVNTGLDPYYEAGFDILGIIIAYFGIAFLNESTEGYYSAKKSINQHGWDSFHLNRYLKYPCGRQGLKAAASDLGYIDQFWKLEREYPESKKSLAWLPII